MIKTPLRSKYLKLLSELNDQFCYFLFARSELRRQFESFKPEIGKVLLPNVFAANPYAPKINIRIDQVPSFEADHERVAFGAYISTSYEVAASYLEEAASLFSQCNAATFHQRRKPSPEDTYWETLAASNCASPEVELRWTLAYIRLRRNHFIHLAASLSSSLTKLLQNDGPALNKYWYPTIKELDFTSPAIMAFRERETIDMLMLLRIVVERLDQQLASQLSGKGVVELVARQTFVKPSRINADVIKQRVQTLNGILQRDFGYNSPPNEAEAVAGSIGVI